MKKFIKKIGKHPSVKKALAGLLYYYLRFAHATIRWTVVIQDDAIYHNLYKGTEPMLVAFWHSRLAMIMPFAPRSRKNMAVVSLHGDGRIIADILQHADIEPIDGSSNKGAIGAAKEAVNALNYGAVVAVAVDGPRGPARQLQGNIVKIAKQTQAPIMPVSWAVKWHFCFNSWDKLVFPLPFCRGVLMCGPRLDVSDDADDKQLKKTGTELEKQLNMLTDQVDAAVGVVDKASS